MRRWCRGSSLHGVVRNASTIAVASSCVCIRAPTETTCALLCWRASDAVSVLHASAARMPATLFAAICSPLPDPPMTMPSEPGSSATAWAACTQNGG